MLPAVKEIIETVLQQNASAVLRAVPLTNNTVQRRIDKMSSDVLKHLVEILLLSKHSLQIDKSTLSDNESLLSGYVRFIHNMQAQEEMILPSVILLIAKSFFFATTVFDAVDRFQEEKGDTIAKYIAMCNKRCCGNVGKHREFIALTKKKIPRLLATHCLIHWQHLVACNLSAELHSLHVVIKCIHKVKVYSLNNILLWTLSRQQRKF